MILLKQVRCSSLAPRNPRVKPRVFRFQAPTCATPAQESGQPALVVLTKPGKGESLTDLWRVALALEVIHIAGAYPTLSAIRTCLGGGSKSTIIWRLSQLGVRRAYDDDDPPPERIPSEALADRIIVVASKLERAGVRPTVETVRRAARASPADVSWTLRTIRGRLAPKPPSYSSLIWRDDAEWFVLLEEENDPGSGTPSEAAT